MYANEPGVMQKSQLFMHTASLQAKRAFFYPLCTGHYYYEPGYFCQRNNYDSFLILFSKSGEGILNYHGMEYNILPGQLFLIDCYEPHAYHTNTNWECVWLHFDGICAREYYKLIVASLGNVFTVKNIYLVEKLLHAVFTAFAASAPIREIHISQQICNVLTELALSENIISESEKYTHLIEAASVFVNQNISESITLEMMAEKASLSPYYFSRLFKQETGFSPYRFVLETRINHAKYYLKTTELSIKELAYKVGFKSESSFCTAFKKLVKLTPSEYRDS